MVRVLLVSVLLCALLPFQALAQDPSPPPLVSAPTASGETPPASQPAPSGEEPPQGELIPHRVKRKPRSATKPDSPSRTAEILGGILLESAAAFPGMKLAWDGLFFCDTCDPGKQRVRVFGGLGLTVAGLTLGSTLGIVLGGNLTGGEGRFLPTLAGAALGTLAGIGAGIVMGSVFIPLAILPLIAGPIIGGVIQYERSHDAAVARQRKNGAGVAWLPTVSVSPGGGVVGGLVGRF